MATLKLIQFSGEIPRLLPRLLPESASQRAENVRLNNGGLSPIRYGRLVDTVVGIPEGDVRTIYKNGEDWLAWDSVVNAVQGPVATDRLYYTGDGAPKMLVAGVVYDLAMPLPTVPLVAALGGVGSGNITERLYVYTDVSAFGEESEPCPASNVVDWQPGNTVTLSGFVAPPAGRNITLQRIYRAQSSVASGTDLFFIAERATSTANYVDSIPIDSFGEVLPSRDWNAPPAGLTGLISLPNGMMAGFVGKDLYFSEPYRPHAWPESYVLTMDFDIVALGCYAATIVVATTGVPYLVTGQAPENMFQEKLELNLPCVNARGLVDLGYAVAYPSRDGLVVVASGTAGIATATLLTRDGWLRISPGTFVAGQFEGRYFASYEYIEVDDTPTRGTLQIDLAGTMPFIIRSNVYAEACYFDVTTSSLYMLSGLEIYEWDAQGEIPMAMNWKSKQFVIPEPVNFGCILIEGASSFTDEELAAQAAARAVVAARNLYLFGLDTLGGEFGGSALNVYPINGDEMETTEPEPYLNVKIIADDVIVANISTINQVVRLPSGFKARNWEVEVSGTTEIAQITMATTVRELNSV